MSSELRRRTAGVSTAPPDETPTSLVAPARRRELPMTCCARIALTCVVLISVLTLLIAFTAAYYARDARNIAAGLANVTMESVATRHHQNALDVARAALVHPGT